VDPENRLLWRTNRRRLDFEAQRDTLLAVAGRLDGTMRGAPVELTSRPFSPRRTIYGFIDRQNLPGLFRTFDFPSPDSTSPQRYETTVPQQALFMMNGPFVMEQVRQLVHRPELQNQQSPEARVQALYSLVFSRPAEPDEISLGLRFIESQPAVKTDAAQSANSMNPWERYVQVLLMTNEFVFVD
jgi:hypothetical protein